MKKNITKTYGQKIPYKKFPIDIQATFKDPGHLPIQLKQICAKNPIITTRIHYEINSQFGQQKKLCHFKME